MTNRSPSTTLPMTLHSHLPLLPSNATDSMSEGHPCASSSSPDITYIQDGEGCYHSFVWHNITILGLNPEKLSHSSHGVYSSVAPEGDFQPIALTPYLNRIQHVLVAQTPDQFECPVKVAEHYFLFDLIISPVLVPHQKPSQVLVIGRCLQPLTETEAIASTEDLSEALSKKQLNRYQELLSDVAWNIRRTLDLETIWKHTVDGLGRALDTTRCLICLYQVHEPQLTVVGEYCQQSNLPSIRDHWLPLNHQSYLTQALETLKPIRWQSHQSEGEPIQPLPLHAPAPSNSISSKTIEVPHPSLAVATSYQDAPNGLILIWQSERAVPLNDADISLIQEFADQVGTGIAHASLFTASQDLAVELGQANHELAEAHKQAEEASRLKSEFLANTSHELRTPLNGMIGFLRLVLDGTADDPDEQQEFVSEAYHSALHLLNLINDILDVARIEAGRMQIEMDSVNLNELLSEVERFTRTQAEQKNLTYTISTPSTGDEILVHGNYQRLLQVLLNLVGNAIKFTEEGSVCITAELEDAEDLEEEIEQPVDTGYDKQDDTTTSIESTLSGNTPLHEHLGHVKISVEDTGIGVPLEAQYKLFQTFSQVEASRARRFGGSGLGLVISQKLVEEMGGVVNFFSMGENCGSTVTFTVPLYQTPVLMNSQAELEDQLEQAET